MGHGANRVTNNDNVSRFLWRALRAIGLCGTLAFVISVASPADDELQQEFLAGRTRQHAARLLRVTHPGARAGRIVPAKALPADCSLRQPATTPASITIDRFQLPGTVQAHKTGDRSPPRFLF